ncbi:MAG: DsrH/TusB family sulfur metabolism protein [Candidatus Jordarchaeum sp.]|uniref:DsrH/TusB family sulfur metabolism protein n=1 Tax=Candidatus Jordarchaeum sp. TaxID=2823881 RepID=UPI004049CAF1
MSKIVSIIIAPPISERVVKAFNIINEMIRTDANIFIYLIGDGVYCGIKGMNLSTIDSGRIQVFASKEDLEARGIQEDLLSKDVKCQYDLIEKMIVDIMESADRILCF